SRNVSTYNPLTGDLIVKRNVTIPLPSFLWNNPTLHLDFAYRDMSPITNATVILHTPNVSIFRNISIDVTESQNGTLVPLVANVSRVQSELDAITAQLAIIQTLKDQIGGILGQANAPPIGALGDQFARIQTDLQTRKGELEALTNATSIASSVASPQLTNVIQSLVSRLDHQHDATNQSGNTTFPNLFSGSYELYEPYPYPILSNLNHEYDYASPGQGGLEGPLFDVDETINRNARRAINNFPVHVSADNVNTTNEDAPPMPDVPASCLGTDACDYLPFFEIDGGRLGPYHQFDLALNGPDLLGVACEVLRDLASKTHTPLSYPGCDAPLIPHDSLEASRELVQFAECMLGLPYVTLPKEHEVACGEFAKLAARAREECTHDAAIASCLDKGNYDAVQVSLESLLQALLSQGASTRVLVPFVHSSARVLAQDPASMGFTEDKLLGPTRETNPLSTKTDQELKNDIRAVLDRIAGLVNGTITLTPPPRETTENRTQVQGILHHATDKISGLDWYHWSLDARPTVGDPTTQLQKVKDMPVNQTDKDLLQRFAANPILSKSEQAAAIMSGRTLGIAGIRDRLREGWLPNGTLTPEGLNLSAEGPTSMIQINASAVCELEALRASVTAPYIRDCEAIANEVHRPNLYGPAGVDSVQFTNALLEQLHQHPEQEWNNTITGPAVSRGILQTATAVSLMGLNESWNRTTDAILMNASGTSLALGVLAYSTPVPTQEFIQYRIDAEILAKNTGLLLVTTTSPLIAETIVGALATLNVSDVTAIDKVTWGSAADVSDWNVGDTSQWANKDPQAEQQLGLVESAATRVTSTLQQAIEALGGDSPYLRVDAIGLPVGIEEKAGRGGTPVAGCQACARGLVTVRPDSFYNYSRAHEMDTKDNPASTLYALIVYFPTIPQSQNLALEEKLVLRNVSIQLTTYVGLANEGGRDSHEFNVSLPIRTRANVEEWNMLYAAPDQHLGDLSVNFSMGSQSYDPTPSDLLRSYPTSQTFSWCAESVAPGYPVAPPLNFIKGARLVPAASGFMYKASENTCITDAVVALKPKHVTTQVPFKNWTTSTPSKKMTDALQYVYNVNGGVLSESFTKSAIEKRAWTCNLLCDLDEVSLVGDPTGILDPTGGLAQEAIGEAKAGLQDAYGEATTSLRDV
ncbi:MAG: hypothetical protein WDA27_14870, partial [Actinomycetota bacterium]